MGIETGKPAAVPAAGLIAGLAGLARNDFGLLLSRLELAALELSAAFNQLLKLALMFALAIVAAWFAIACGTALIVYMAWDSMGWTILLIIGLVFAAMAAGLLLHAISMARHDRLGMPATRAELRADLDTLS